jgi:hypothetical protein
LGVFFIIKGLNRRADNKSVPLQDGIPNGWKVGSTTRGRTAFEHQIIRRFGH